jgi:hypothetical protein
MRELIGRVAGLKIDPNLHVTHGEARLFLQERILEDF